ncbi:MAG: Flp pilus assembly complex ATPase component TadA [Nitrospirae bacterium]|nr:Flp pilus assembly complex ATPase component TadA [Nitrospirota bacterium]
MLIGEVLTNLYGLKQEDIEKALELQKKLGGYIGQILIQTGSITETQLIQALSKQLDIPIYNKDEHKVNGEGAISLPDSEIDMDFVVKNNFIPVGVDHKKSTITFITNDPLNNTVADYVIKTTGYNILTLLATEQTINELSGPYTGGKGSDFVSLHIDDTPEKLKEMAFEAPVIKFLNNILSRAVELRATDVHIEPVNSKYRVRFRIDGILHDMESLEAAFYLATVSRIKLLSGLDIAEKRLPQDGKFSTKIASAFLDIRVSTIPTVKGEGVVMRLLYRERLTFDIMRLGMESDHAKTIIELISRPYGILLVTGPTGSGKTTTLYSMLTRLNSEERKIVTVEDPVEYQLEGINQIQVKSDIGLSFASSLRSILRHDPDIIMVGEIRDRETAEISIQSAMTGHLVLSTLHTNDAPSSLFRLIEMGMEDYLLNASVIGVIAQRIVRKNCPDCSHKYYPPESVLEEYGLRNIYKKRRDMISGDMVFIRGDGCQVCAGTGYRGRIAIFECFNYTDDLKDIFLRNRSLESLRARLNEAHNFRSLREDGMLKVMKGLTTIEDVLRVC